MKKSMFLFGALFAAGLSFTACSDKDVEAENGTPGENGGGNYIAIGINLPTSANAAMTRTTDNAGDVTYDDGDATEYAVNNISLLIFDGSDNFLEAYTLADDTWKNDDDDDNVTTYQRFTQQVSSSVTTSCKMLVILNHNDLITVNSNNSLTIGGALFSGSYSNFQQEITSTTGLDCGVMKTTGFYMANAPLSNTAGSGSTDPSSATLQVLVPITNVYASQTAADAATNPDQIYVERGMAKVTMESSTGTYTNSKVDGTADIAWTVAGWTLDNTNPNSYYVRSTENFDTYKSFTTNKGTEVYRVIGNQPISWGSPTFKYRLYFSESANYGTVAKSSTNATPVFTLNTFTKSGDANSDNIDDGFSKSFTAAQYCFENTFPVYLQNVNQTTLAQVAVTTTVGGSAPGNIYTLGGNKTVVYTEATVYDRIKAAASAYVEANKGTLVTSGTTVSSSDFGVTSLTLNAENQVTGFVLTYAASTGDAVINTSNFESGTTLNSTICGNIFSSMTGGVYTQYTGGVSYYHIRIKHFGDNLTPWNDGETPAPSADFIYPNADNTVWASKSVAAKQAENNYLGRYGVLRNNWYNLKVKSIKSLGDAVPHTGNWPSTPDDEVDKYITFQINILSWAKRPTQEQDL